MHGLTHWLEDHLLTCWFKATTGVDCPGCGMQRAVLALLNGNVQESFVLYPALMPILTLFGFLAMHLKFKFLNGAVVLQWMFVACVATIVGSYIVKMVS